MQAVRHLPKYGRVCLDRCAWYLTPQLTPYLPTIAAYLLRYYRRCRVPGYSELPLWNACDHVPGRIIPHSRFDHRAVVKAKAPKLVNSGGNALSYSVLPLEQTLCGCR